MSQATIGVFDSGVGGLSVLAELRRELPQESFTYLADTAHVPYGDRSDEEIRRLTETAARCLQARGCKALVVACNTASAYGLQHLRQVLPDWPIVGLVPAVKPAAERTRSGVIGVMATPATLRGNVLQNLLTEWAVPRGVEVMLTTSPQLVPLVERGAADSDDARALLRELLRPLAEAGADQLVLGCTHYPYLASSIRREFGEQFTLIDSGRAVARQTRRVLDAAGRLAPEGTVGGIITYLVTGDAQAAQPVMSQLVGEEVTVQAVRGCTPNPVDINGDLGEASTSAGSQGTH